MATDATKTVNRIIDTFPPMQQQQVRYQLASNIKAVISQRLVEHVDGHRVPAAEVLIATVTVQEYIIDAERTTFIPDIMAKSREQYSMQTMDQCLHTMHQKGTISMETALASATNASDFQRAMDFE